mmetsp:Transcript_15416/g.39340  ORF Transcript_15416/g.39340 Transcript_15416/m.39340 type:complete len:365 (-) Transcript_15416:172-1266(-)
MHRSQVSRVLLVLGLTVGVLTVNWVLPVDGDCGCGCGCGLQENEVIAVPRTPLEGMHLLMDIHEEVQRALDEGQAVVALESTIISHGMPYPQNVETARAVEDIVRRGGAVPATIAIIDGRIKVGLSDAHLDALGRAGKTARKVSRRDVALTVAAREFGATTVAATMLIAHEANIPVFVTGGIGGVHRGVEKSMDISADLIELGRTPVAVVCAGVKSILDIPRTLEFLETNGVPTIGYQSSRFPAFFTPDSGYDAHIQLNSALEVAVVIDAQLRLQLNTGLVIAVPVPSAEAADSTQIEQAISDALEEASIREIQGKEMTPFLLQRVNELTGGDSLRSNIALVKNNARVGTEIAVSLSNLRKEAA